MRTVVLREYSGRVHTIPYNSIDTVTNYTKDYSYAVFEIGVAYRESVDQVMDVLREIGREMNREPSFRRLILEPLEVAGVDRFAEFRGRDQGADQDPAAQAVGRHPRVQPAGQELLRRARHRRSRFRTRRSISGPTRRARRRRRCSGSRASRTGPTTSPRPASPGTTSPGPASPGPASIGPARRGRRPRRRRPGRASGGRSPFSPPPAVAEPGRARRTDGGFAARLAIGLLLATLAAGCTSHQAESTVPPEPDQGAADEAGPAVPYQVEFQGVDDPELQQLLKQVSETQQLVDRPPPSLVRLRTRGRGRPPAAAGGFALEGLLRCRDRAQDRLRCRSRSGCGSRSSRGRSTAFAT